MSQTPRVIISFSLMAGLLIAVGMGQSWSLALAILNLCLISAVMALGVNIQWGYAGLFNVGIMGFAALGGVAAALVSKAPVGEAWAAGGINLAFAAVILVAITAIVIFVYRRMRRSVFRLPVMLIVAAAGYMVLRSFFDPAVIAIEAVNPGKTGYLGGMGLPIIFSWAVGGLFVAGGAWLIGKLALGLRADYLAIATLGISEIIVAILKNEDWLTRGVKNITGLSRPVPYEVNLQQSDWFIGWVSWWNEAGLASLADADRASALTRLTIEASGLFVKICYAGLFAAVLVFILTLCVLALDSPWGRMVRAIRDREVAADAMGKDVTGRHLQIFVLGSAVVGMAGAMLTTLDGQFTPGTYNPLRFTFLIWVMVVVGGSGNNLGAVIGGFLIWFVWIEAEPMGRLLMDVATAWMDDASPVKLRLINSAQHMRVLVMGLVLLLVMRFAPGGILPEQTKRH